MDKDNKRQKPIPVTSFERTQLEQYKSQYEKKSGQSGDWGDFLGAVALLGLATLGVYALVEATKQTPQSANVNCSYCHNIFAMTMPPNSSKIINVKCPYCQQDLVVRIN